MILCDTEIKAAINNGQLIVKPSPPDSRFTTSALDLSLGDEFKHWRLPEGDAVDIIIDPSRPGAFKQASQFLVPVSLERDGSVILRPGEFMLARTQEWIELPRTARLAARVEGRSSLARLGVAVHLTAPVIHAGFRGYITLEITNPGPLPIRLRPGMQICQLVLELLFGTPSKEMTGLFQDQASVTGREGEG